MTILLSSEVAEEIEEAILLARAATQTEQIVVHAPAAVLEKARISHHFGLTIVPVKAFSYRARVLPKLSGLAEFIALVLRTRPRVIMSGFSMMKHRVMSRVLRIPHVSYIRGLMFNPDTKLGISDKLRYGVFRGRNVRVLNAFEASHVLTVAQINEDFMVARGVDRERIHQVGPVWLRDVPPARATQDSGRVFFVTKAFEAHGVDEAHRRQTETIRQLAASFPGQLCIRAHPRDFYAYEEDAALRDVSVARSTPREFLLSLTQADILISPLSTMAFEALHVGARVVFFTAEGVTDDLTKAYRALGITPHPLDDLASAVQRARAGEATHVKVFSAIDETVAAQVLVGAS
ncbi:hypothetical protein [Microbacterium sp. NPDC096154]|uniref:hypothetical protein n=1 Tax=Microbacterium sp. NPDC096154 TaxID=3155549 RepID=UPI0033344FBE